MSDVHLSYFFHDSDSPAQVALICVDPATFPDGSMAAALHQKLSGESVSDGIFQGCVRSGHGSWFTGAQDDVVHAYLYDLAQAREDLSSVVRDELAHHMAAGTVLVEKIQTLEGNGIGWLVVEMAVDKAHLGSDSFEGL